MDFHTSPRFPRGFSCAARHCGIKKEGKDLALFHSEVPCQSAAIFTRNHFPGAPIIVGRELIRGGRLQSVVVNSKVSNVATGAEGIANARRMGRAAAAELGIPDELVLMSSTGVIGRQLPIEKVEAGLEGMAKELCEDPLVGAEGIMTTDTVPKAFSCSIGGATLTAVGKGAGMIAPNMATMLVYLFTDAELTAEQLDAHLRRASRRTFECMSVDTDTSTSDTAVLMANGLAGPVDDGLFGEALEAICLAMAERVARDGEGATKLLRVRVHGALTLEEARLVSRSISDSPLVKTMVHGADPNVGRVLMAIGKRVECRIVPERVSVRIQGVEVVRGGQPASFPDAEVRELLSGDPVEIEVDLGVGGESALALGCDLTEGYIRENAAYASS